ncbi:hypothetical protein M8681_22205, partial [Escherichia coli]|nr:hypothetical protein [Escherichia coli]
MTFSLFGDKFTRHSGITLLMEDLNDGLRTPGAIMLGGGNPAQIPEMQDYFQTLLTDMLESGKALMNPLMILVKIIKLRWIHILSYDQMVSRKINNQTTRCANSIF